MQCVPQWPANLQPPSLLSFNFNQLLPAHASGLLTLAAAALPDAACECRPDTFCVAAATTLQLPLPPYSTSCRRQPVSPASPGPLRYARYLPPPPLCYLTPPQPTRVSPPPPVACAPGTPPPPPPLSWLH
jgi:hypothetical protein